jgi:hypothetical protein
LLVEPKWAECGEKIDEAEFVGAIWPLVQRANTLVPKYGRIAKNKIRLAVREKPFELTPKGTTKRYAVNKEYKEEIDAIYVAADNEMA